MKKIPTFFLLCFLLFEGIAIAQTHKSDCAKSPCWIAMMNDTSANYFETVEAFEAFWEGKILPQGEHEDIGEDISPQAKKDPNRGDGSKQEFDPQAYRFEVKKYHHWQQRVLPYVQEDGHILTPNERLEIWKSHNTRP